MLQADWLTHLVRKITLAGRLESRCVYRAPWRLSLAQSAEHEIPYHVILQGRAFIEVPETGWSQQLVGGDIVLFPRGASHVLHDGSGRVPGATHNRARSSGWTVSENDGQGEQLEMLCGRLFIGSPHDRLIRDYLPTNLVVRALYDQHRDGRVSASDRLASLVRLMQAESIGDNLGGSALLNVLSSALFTLALRAASESECAPTGLLALAGHRGLVPAISAMLADPVRPWSLSALADSCGMSRETFMRQCRSRLGCSALKLLSDIRMGLAAYELEQSRMTIGAVANLVGYRSVTAFRRVFTNKTGMTPRQWRHRRDDGGQDISFR